MAVVGKRRRKKRYTTMNRWLYESRPVFLAAVSVWLIKYSDIGQSPVGKASAVVLLGAAFLTFYLRHTYRSQSRR
ncbi:MAG: hypothetical protein KDD61_15005 [Bdellovibrionales bacterium]|nr:hypothetical protein [Bdellovibrionales bacterium]